MPPPSQLGPCPTGWIDSTLLSSHTSSLEPRRSFRIKYCRGEGKAWYSLNGDRVACGLGLLSKCCCTQIQILKVSLGCRRKGTRWWNLHVREPEERKTQCSALHVCSMLLPGGVRTHLQSRMDYPGFVQVHEISRATHLLISSLGIRNWRVGNE